MSRTRYRPAAVFVLLLLVAPASAQQRDHDITVEDYFTLATIFDSAIAPDGKHVAYTEGRWRESTNDRKADLWVVPTKGEPARRLTFDRAGDRSPKWSPDSRTIYFLGGRKREGEKQPPFDGKTQVWRVSDEGGEPTAVTRVEGGVTLFAVTDQHLYYVVGTESADEEWKDLRKQFNDVEYGHGVRNVSEVWRLDLRNWRSEKVIDEDRYISNFAVSRDARRIVMLTAPDDRVISNEGKSRVDVYDAETRKITPVPDKLFRADAPSPYGWLEHLAISPDGSHVAFDIVFDAYPAEIIIADFAKGGDPIVTKFARPDGLHVKGYGSPLAWRGKGNDLCFLGEQQGRVRLCSANAKGTICELTPGDVVVQSFSLSESGEHAATLMNGPATLEDIHLIGIGTKEKTKQLTDVNPQSASWKFPKLSVVSWKAPDGKTVEGILELPPDAKPGQKLPLVVAIHGGPTHADYYHLQFWIYGRVLLPAKGYAVLCPNYRGSTGYGDAFVTDLVGRENDVDVKDILAGVDHLVEQGIADPDRLAVMGWSNGGYLTNCIITTTDRFKAASSGAGIVDAVIEWGTNDEPAYTMVLKKGFPWNAADRYHKASPSYALNKVRTPTLIHVGANDERCPPGHSRMLYRALREYNKVPTQLLVYPGEPHGLGTYKHRRAKMEWDLAWFEKYVGGEEK